MLAAVLVGAMVEAVAILQQLAWHAAHRDEEPFGSLLLAHAGIYLGAALGTWGAWRSLRARWAPGLALVATAGVARVAAVLVDAWLHARGFDPLPAHALYKLGIGLALAGALLLARPWPRRVSVAAR